MKKEVDLGYLGFILIIVLLTFNFWIFVKDGNFFLLLSFIINSLFVILLLFGGGYKWNK